MLGPLGPLESTLSKVLVRPPLGTRLILLQKYKEAQERVKRVQGRGARSAAGQHTTERAKDQEPPDNSRRPSDQRKPEVSHLYGNARRRTRP